LEVKERYIGAFAFVVYLVFYCPARGGKHQVKCIFPFLGWPNINQVCLW